MGRSIPQIDEAALAALAHHPYQGNVRELENIIEKTMVFLTGEEVRLDDLPMEVRQGPLSYRATQAGVMIPVRIGQDLDSIQKNVILATLDHFQGNKQKTAEVLKISERKLWYKLKEYE